ncbi:kinesin-like protein KIF18B isoform X1 [Chelonia mydas]|uniref:kinesin-like protein KIF18B isoform X1 n=1 Tax=Chelonia mydas TaxID=8469 RepID=UPI000FFB9D64|nr:kinesin-like protein KIF18B isoform X1 [Chelonia mydas]XP_043392881.1 kinesin-like protein KIF18B isoform X1 [Chelonia mydas]XP_043392883.1 kinesin-like protein KIF18B isoform X1 [Chelonia mydas]
MVSVLPTEEGNVAVVVRVRPQNQQEREGSRHAVVQVIGDSMLVFDPEEPRLSGVFTGFRGHDAPKRKGKDLKFVFDQVFGESATQEEVFQHTTKEILDGVLNGYNCSVFAYGATGAGKTYTMLGSEKSPGIMYLTMVELYKRIEARKEEKSCEVLISYQEVYNEQIHDLLEPKGPLAIREDPEKGVVVQGLSFHQPKSAEQLLEMLASGNRNRTQHPTDANATSSRSHAVFQIFVKQQDRVVGITQDLQVAKMSLIDLAGSERASTTNTKGERLREGANINRSLLALINVINALADAKSRKSHIPYRDSKLTRLLKDSLGGNCRTIMIAAISPSALAYEDTYNTLKYANRAKEIKLSLKSNVLSLDCHITKYAAICEQLKAEVANLREKLQAYERNTQDPDHQVPAPQAQSSPWQVELLRSAQATQEGSPDHEVPEKGNQEMVIQQQELKVRPSFQQQDLGAVEQMPEKELHDYATDLQQKTNKPSSLLQGLPRDQTQRLVIAVLRVAQRQYSLLKAANLLTPDMVSEFEELEYLVQRETGRSQEPAGTLGGSEVTPAQEEQQHSDNVVPLAAGLQGAPATECAAPMTRSVTQSLQELALVPSPSSKTPSLPTKKRRRSEMSSPSKTGTPATPKRQAKRQRKSSLPSRRRGSANESTAPPVTISHSTPIVKEAKPSQLVPYCIPKPCPSTVTKSRVPLATSAAQNCCTPATLTIRDLNITFDLAEDSCSSGVDNPVKFSSPEFPGWENVQCILKKSEVSFMPRAAVPVFTMKGSSIPPGSIPKLPSVSKAMGQKRKRSVSAASRSLGGLRSQSRIARLQSSTVKSLQTPSVPEPPSCPLGKSSREDLQAVGGKMLAAPGSRAMKLFC